MSFVLPPWAQRAEIPPQRQYEGLSPRLSALWALIPEGSRVADIGTDHALLPQALLSSQRASFVVGCDRAQEPLEAAAQRLGEPLPFELRRGEGLMPLEEGEVDALVVAGFGGRKMIEVLVPARLSELGIGTLVVQPTAGMPSLRVHLAEAGWLADAEQMIREGDRGFLLARFRRGRSRSLTPWEALIGRNVEPRSLLRAWLEVQARHFEQMVKAGAAKGAQAQALLRQIWDYLEECED